MRSRLIRTKNIYNPGDKKLTQEEPRIDNISFNVYKFNNRIKPEDPKRIVYIPCFSELGCEIVSTMFCIPRVSQKLASHYKIAIGWYGREYLYRNIVDEFWEINEEHMWLREYCRAFHHESKNLARFEGTLKSKGIIITPSYMGKVTMMAQCNKCGNSWKELRKVVSCKACGSPDIRNSLFGDMEEVKKNAVFPKSPSNAKLEFARGLVEDKAVAVFARARKCYGRNLPSDFYVKLIGLLEEMGYNPIWLGEKATTLPCPVKHIVDFSRMKESRDLETTVALLSLCRFSVQFWTASTRLAAIAGIPYLLFESPDQLYGNGQEGYRLRLVSGPKKKIAVNHFLSVYNNHELGLEVAKKCIKEMENGNYDDVIGLVDDLNVVNAQKTSWEASLQ